MGECRPSLVFLRVVVPFSVFLRGGEAIPEFLVGSCISIIVHDRHKSSFQEREGRVDFAAFGGSLFCTCPIKNF